MVGLHQFAEAAASEVVLAESEVRNSAAQSAVVEVTPEIPVPVMLIAAVMLVTEEGVLSQAHTISPSKYSYPDVPVASNTFTVTVAVAIKPLPSGVPVKVGT